MRVCRSIQLYSSQGFVHKYWRCHNREYLLRPPTIKSIYLNCTKKALEKSKQGLVEIGSFCLMDNHCHIGLSYKGGSKSLSEFMRYSHGKFGRMFNNINKRSGKVAESRPKTPLIEDENHLIKVHLYIEANPIRAGMCTPENLKRYKYSSFGFYAYGIKTEFTKILTVPDWYKALGKTPSQRQAQYRKLFYGYLRTSPSNGRWFFEPFIGKLVWVQFQEKRALDAEKQKLELKAKDSKT